MIFEQMSIVSDNHEKIKQEMLMLHEVLLKAESEYVLLAEELKKRTQ